MDTSFSSRYVWIPKLAVAVDPLCYASLVPVGTSEDLRQDCIVALIEEKPSTETDAKALIAKILSSARTRRRRLTARMRSFGDNEDPHREVTGDHWVEKLRESLDLLPATDQRLIDLRYSEGKSLKDIGTLVGLSQPTLRNRFEAILKKLEALLK
ncbi:hypothetical protein BH10ACI4_BH10ACI4_25160 [soil metagenome]